MGTRLGREAFNSDICVDLARQHGAPALVLAQHLGRNLRFKGSDRPRSNSCRQDPQGALVAYRQGLPDLDTAIQLDPSYAPVRRHRGNTIVAAYRALKALGKPTNDVVDRAIEDFRAAVKLDPTSKISANALGEAYLIKRSYHSAIESFNEAIGRDPKYAAPYSGLCVAYRMLGHLAEARKNAQLAADRDSDLRSKARRRTTKCRRDRRLPSSTPAEHGWVRASSGARCSTRTTAAGRTRTISRTVVNASLA